MQIYDFSERHPQDIEGLKGAPSGLAAVFFICHTSSAQDTSRDPAMSVSRSPSPRPNGGWATPSFTTSRRSSPHMNGFAPGSSSSNVSWTAAKTTKSRGYPSFQTKNEGFFQRSRRKISTGLPRFNSFKDKDWKDSEKLGRGRWYPGGGGRLGRLKTFVGTVLRRFKFLILILVLVLLSIWAMKVSSMKYPC